MSKQVDIIIVDDHKIFREGLGFILTNHTGLQVIGEASNGKEFLEILEKKKPDLVIIDISMPVMNGIEATKLAIKKYPDLNILALSMFGDENYYFEMISAGAKGFILKESEGSELIEAVETILMGKNYFSQELLRNIIFSVNNKFNNFNKHSNKFTKRELEVLTYICQGLTNEEIANTMFLSQRTIEGHKSNLLKKASVKNTVNLIMYAIKNELLELG